MQMKIKYPKIRKAAAVLLMAAAAAAGCARHSTPLSVIACAASSTEMPQVYPCGFPVGIYMNTCGVMVVSTTQIPTDSKTLRSPCEGSLEQGDYITSIDGIAVNSKEELVSRVENCSGQPLLLHVVREEEEFDLSVVPVQDLSGTYRLGVWVKDDVQGIGTLTYICEDGSFGALGHPINDSDTGKRVCVRKGGLYESQIQMVIRGKNGTPGSFCGIICYDPSTFLGNIYENSSFGIYGNISVRMKERLGSLTKMQAARRDEVVCGSALLRCCVSETAEDYEVEIIKTQPNGTGGLQIRVTDEALLEKTGGIIQGMSGSPLIQNGKVIGAVTHVFVNDPTKGYAIYMEDMLEHPAE